MPTILVVTVGGSPAPLITAHETVAPDRLVFVCSEQSRSQVLGEGKPCVLGFGDEAEKLPNLVKHLDLANFEESRDLITIPVDDLSSAYRILVERLSQLQGEGDVSADYTGGSKTMTAALAMAAVDLKIPLLLTTGKRADLVKVTRGEATELVATGLIHTERSLTQELPGLLASYSYGGAARMLQQLMVSRDLSPEARPGVRFLLAWAKALDSWDRFDHKEAQKELEQHKERPAVRALLQVLQRIQASRAALEGQDFVCKSFSGYEILEDLLHNAERRAARNRFDDAVGRLYRALELMAQIYLKKKHSLETGNLRAEQLPDGFTAQADDDGKIRLGLQRSYELVAAFEKDPLGDLYLKSAGQLKNALQTRNYSLFAHGFAPIGKGTYQGFARVVVGFLREALEVVKHPNDPPRLTQLPSTRPD